MGIGEQGGATRAPRNAVEAAIKEMGELPVLDRTVEQVRRLADDPGATTQDIVVVLERDANLATNLIRLANAGLSHRPVRATSLHQAVTLVGRRAVGRLALEAAVCSFFERAPGSGGVARGHLHVHAVEVASCAAELARRVGIDDAEAHLAGLLHDMGKLVLPVAFGAALLDALSAETAGGPDRVVAERAALGTDHAEAGALLAAHAGLSTPVVDAICAHHGPPIEAPDAPKLTACVQVANATVALVHAQPADELLLDVALGTLGLPMSCLEEISLTALPAATAEPTGPALAEQVARLEREARTDELTGLLNRRYWSLAAREELTAREGSVLICDVDHFKRINDFHGHHTGDYVLAEIGRILGTHGVAGRLGGDEFALLVPAPRDGEQVAGDIATAVAATFEDPTMPVTLSIGVAASGAPGVEPGELLRRADGALYEAKRAGRATARCAHV